MLTGIRIIILCVVNSFISALVTNTVLPTELIKTENMQVLSYKVHFL